jgi:hypothetical protein
MSADTSGAAFPYEHKEWDVDDQKWRTHFIHEGMSLRDYFAAKAMAALIVNGGAVHKHTPDGTLIVPARQGIPPMAYEYADAMLKARQA